MGILISWFQKSADLDLQFSKEYKSSFIMFSKEFTCIYMYIVLHGKGFANFLVKYLFLGTSKIFFEQVHFGYLLYMYDEQNLKLLVISSDICETS